MIRFMWNVLACMGSVTAALDFSNGRLGLGVVWVVIALVYAGLGSF